MQQRFTCHSNIKSQKPLHLVDDSYLRSSATTVSEAQSTPQSGQDPRLIHSEPQLQRWLHKPPEVAVSHQFKTPLQTEESAELGCCLAHFRAKDTQAALKTIRKNSVFYPTVSVNKLSIHS